MTELPGRNEPLSVLSCKARGKTSITTTTTNNNRCLIEFGIILNRLLLEITIL